MSDTVHLTQGTSLALRYQNYWTAWLKWVAVKLTNFLDRKIPVPLLYCLLR